MPGLSARPRVSCSGVEVGMLPLTLSVTSWDYIAPDDNPH